MPESLDKSPYYDFHDPDDRHRFFVATYERIGLSNAELSVWFYQEDNKNNRATIARKLSNRTGVTKSDVGLIHALSVIKGYKAIVKDSGLITQD